MFCSKCGNEIEEGEKFCSKCGFNVSAKQGKKIDILKKRKVQIYIIIFVLVIIIGIIIYFNKSQILKEDPNNEYIENYEYNNQKYIDGEQKTITLYDIKNKNSINDITLTALLENYSIKERANIQIQTIEKNHYIINENLIGTYLLYKKPLYENEGFENYGIEPLLTGYKIEAIYGIIKVNNITTFLENNNENINQLISNNIIETQIETKKCTNTFIPNSESENSYTLNYIEEQAFEKAKEDIPTIRRNIIDLAKNSNWINKDENIEKPKNEYIIIDNTAETGATYTITLEDVEKALKDICKESNINNYGDFKFINDNNYNSVYESEAYINNNKACSIIVQVHNGYVVDISHRYAYLNDLSFANNTGKTIFIKMINKLFSNEYGNKITSILNNLSDNTMYYTDYTKCVNSSKNELYISSSTPNSYIIERESVSDLFKEDNLLQ